jgi:hypothetical protein
MHQCGSCARVPSHLHKWIPTMDDATDLATATTSAPFTMK